MDKNKLMIHVKRIDVEHDVITLYNDLINQDYVTSGYFSSAVGDFLYDIKDIKAKMEERDENKKKCLKTAIIKTHISKYDRLTKLIEQ
jgi:hypothetical protein